MRKVVDYFVANGSTVNLCSLDITKAFDKMNHSALFLKVMKRRMPLAFMRVLVNCIVIVLLLSDGILACLCVFH